MRVLAASSVMLLLLAGCAGIPDSTENPSASTAAANRPNLVHAGGALLAEAAPVVNATLFHTGWATFEPTIGITSKGNVFAMPALPADRAFSNRVETGVLRSLDEGATWEVLYPQVAGQRTHQLQFDPFLWVDPDTDRIFAEDLATVNCAVLSISDDEGQTWTNTASGCVETDHQNLFTGPPTMSTTLGYPNIVYRCAYNLGVTGATSLVGACRRSIDGGMTWLPNGEPTFVTNPQGTGNYDLPAYCDGGLGHGAADQETGRVFVPKGWCGQPWIAYSDNEGLTWTRVQVADNGMAADPNDIAGSYYSHDASIAFDAQGLLYYGWVAADHFPYYAVSRDRGATWGEPIMVAPPDVTETSHLFLDARENGTLVVTYYGSTTSPGAPFTGSYDETSWDMYATFTHEADEDAPTFHTTTANPPDDPAIRGYCSPMRCSEWIDFFDVDFDQEGVAWISFVDTCEDFDCDPNAARGDRGRELVIGRVEMPSEPATS